MSAPDSSSSQVVVTAFGRTDVGHVRDDNEDYLVFGDLARGEPLGAGQLLDARTESGCGPLFIVSDGLGGAASGEIASRMAAEMTWQEMAATEQTQERMIFARVLRRAVRVANRYVWELARHERKHRGMGTTISVAGFVDNALIMAQVGDSRAYILRGGALVQVTCDQSVVSALISTGRIAETQMQELPESHMVLQALGVRRDVEVALSVVELARGDVLLLCTDGLHGQVEHDTIAYLLDSYPDVEEASGRLIEAAGVVGAPDNISVIVARFSGQGLPEPQAGVAPTYTEIDPMEEGDRVTLESSVVMRRLAARVGIGEDPGPPVVPATGQFTAVSRTEEQTPRRTWSVARRRKSYWRFADYIWVAIMVGALLVCLVAIWLML